MSRHDHGAKVQVWCIGEHQRGGGRQHRDADQLFPATPIPIWPV
jgi:hypothetical protein